MGHIFLELAPSTRFFVGWSVTLVCLLLSARIAFAFLQYHPRMFTVMSLLTCSWLCILGRYGAPDEHILLDLITDIASFLFVYIGGLLLLEGIEIRKNGLGEVSSLQNIALVLLVFIAVPRSIDLPTPMVEFLGSSGLKVHQAKFLASLALVLIGFASIGIGAQTISKKSPYLFLIVTLFYYASLTILRDVQLWSECIKVPEPGCIPRPMPVIFVYLFSAAKLGLTLTLGSIVAYHGMTPEIRSKGASYWLKHFFFLAPDVDPSQNSRDFHR